jgi:hypothetical protein
MRNHGSHLFFTIFCPFYWELHFCLKYMLLLDFLCQKFEGEQPIHKSEWCMHEPGTSSVDQFSITVMPTLVTSLESQLFYPFSSVLLIIFSSWLACETQRLWKL